MKLKDVLGLIECEDAVEIAFAGSMNINGSCESMQRMIKPDVLDRDVDGIEAVNDVIKIWIS